VSQCNTGDMHCCDQVQQVGFRSSALDILYLFLIVVYQSDNLSPDVTTLLGLLGIAVGGLNAAVGVNCSPISVIGVGGNSCTQQPVCCTNNNFVSVEYSFALLCTFVFESDRTVSPERSHQRWMQPDQLLTHPEHYPKGPKIVFLVELSYIH